MALYLDKHYRNSTRNIQQSFDWKYLFKNYFRLLAWFFKDPPRFVNVFTKIPGMDLFAFVIVFSLVELFLCNFSCKLLQKGFQPSLPIFEYFNQQFLSKYSAISLFTILQSILLNPLMLFVQAASLHLILSSQKFNHIKYMNCVNIAAVSSMLSIFTMLQPFVFGFGSMITAGLYFYANVIMMHYGYGVSCLRSAISYLLSVLLTALLVSLVTIFLVEFFSIVARTIFSI